VALGAGRWAVKRTTIWVFLVPKNTPGNVRAPQGARWLSVGYQARDMAAWAEVDPEAPIVYYRMEFVGTGWRELPSPDFNHGA